VSLLGHHVDRQIFITPPVDQQMPVMGHGPAGFRATPRSPQRSPEWTGTDAHDDGQM